MQPRFILIFFFESVAGCDTGVISKEEDEYMDVFSNNIRTLVLSALLSVMGLSTHSMAQVQGPIQVSDGFVFPLGPGLIPTSENDKKDNWKLDRTFCEKIKGKSGATLYHLGEDWNYLPKSKEIGQPVHASSVGQVVYAQNQPSSSGIDLGNVVVIRHLLSDNEFVYTLYAHLRMIDRQVFPGAFVSTGQKSVP